jgi:hypothetical protein
MEAKLNRWCSLVSINYLILVEDEGESAVIISLSICLLWWMDSVQVS